MPGRRLTDAQAEHLMVPLIVEALRPIANYAVGTRN
jgi:hypothetical protein